MTTTLVINAISSLVAAAGLGAVAVRRDRRAARVRHVYVTSASRRSRTR